MAMFETLTGQDRDRPRAVIVLTTPRANNTMMRAYTRMRVVRVTLAH